MSQFVWVLQLISQTYHIYSSDALSHFHFKGFFQILTWHFGKLIHRNQHGPTTPKPSQQTATCLTEIMHDPTCVQRISKQSIKAKLPTCIVLVKYSGKGITLNLVVKKNVVKHVDLDFHQVFLRGLENPTQIMWVSNLYSKGLAGWILVFLPIVFRKHTSRWPQSRSKFLWGNLYL